MNVGNLNLIYPEIVLAVFALGLLMIGVFVPSRKLLGVLALAGVIVSAAFLPSSFQIQPDLFLNMLVNDRFSVFFREVILLIAGLVILLSMGYKGGDEEDRGEYYFFILTVTLSMMLGVSTNNLMMIYIVLETVSVISYLLAGYLKRDVFSSEAGIKYFLFGALSTGITLYGISLIYGLFGTLNLSMIFSIMSGGGVNPLTWIFISILLLIGFGFKCSLVPFHLWTPDVYEGAPSPVAAFLSVRPKAMGFAFLMRTFLPDSQWTLLAGILSIVTMTVGNITALKQNNIKRLLAYSTIAHAGFILLGLTVGLSSSLGINVTLFYILVYTLMNLGAFGCVILISNIIKSETIDDYAGLYKRDPLIAVVLAVLLLSLAGIPPLAGFFAKFFILAAVVQSKYFFLAGVAVLNSVVALYYYAKVIKFMFFNEPKDVPFVLPQALILKLTVGTIMIANIIIGIWPQFLMDWLTHP